MSLPLNLKSGGGILWSAAVNPLTGMVDVSAAVAASGFTTTGTVIVQQTPPLSVNGVNAIGGASFMGPELQATGPDANIDFLIAAKGSLGAIKVLGQGFYAYDTTGNHLFFAATGPSNTANFLKVDSTAVGGGDVKVTVIGGDANCGLQLRTAGTGFISLINSNGSVTLLDTAILNCSRDVIVGVGAYNGMALRSSGPTAPVHIDAQGTDGNVGFHLNAKGIGEIKLLNSIGGFTFDSTGVSQLTGSLVIGTGTVNNLTVLPAASGAGPQVAAQGSDTDIDLRLVSKGAGNLDIQNAHITGVAPTAGGAGSPPQPSGYVQVKIGGVQRWLVYYG